MGKPLTIGNFVTQAGISALFTAVTNTYTPYISIGDYDAPASQDQILAGQNYQEVLTNFPFGSQVLTGVFLDIVTSGPNQSSQTYERTLADRIGYVARQNRSVLRLNISPSAQPLLTDLDLFTVDVLTGLNSPTFPGRLPQTLPQAQVAQPTAPQGSPSFDAQANGDLAAERYAVTDLNRAFASYFTTLSDGLTTQLRGAEPGKGVLHQPPNRHHCQRVGSDPTTQQPTLVHSIDLRSDSIRVLAYPGQARHAAVAFNAVRGVSESLAEQEALDEPRPRSERHGRGQYRPGRDGPRNSLTTITHANLSTLDSLDISAEAKATDHLGGHGGQVGRRPDSIGRYQRGEGDCLVRSQSHDRRDDRRRRGRRASLARTPRFIGAIVYLSGFLLFTVALDCVFTLSHGVNCLTGAGTLLAEQTFRELICR